MTNNKAKLVAVILCGGVGSRLWPLSREQLTKPFIKLPTGNTTTMSELLDSLPALNLDELIMVVGQKQLADCNAAIALAKENLPKVTTIIEPEGRGTAAALITAGKLIQEQHGEDACIILLPSDHHIKNRQIFNDALIKASYAAQNNKIVVLGITPDKPATGYGYIQAGATDGDSLEVVAFREKPNEQQAQEFIATKKYYWNAGVFVTTVKTINFEYEKYAKKIFAVANTLNPSEVTDGKWEIAADLYASFPATSIDYAIAEHSENIVVIPTDCGWSDLGTWDEWMQLIAQENNNRKLGNVVFADTYNIDAIAAGHRVVAVSGCDNLIVVDTPDALLVSGKNAHGALRKIHTSLSEKNERCVSSPAAEERPWGRYRQLSSGDNWQAKSIEVEPGKRLSLQSHNHRSERWTVVKGVITVTVGEETYDLKETETCFIPQGTKHRMANNTESKAELIEVQLGDYLGEDDIVRYEDDFGRS